MVGLVGRHLSGEKWGERTWAKVVKGVGARPCPTQLLSASPATPPTPGLMPQESHTCHTCYELDCNSVSKAPSEDSLASRECVCVFAHLGKRG